MNTSHIQEHDAPQVERGQIWRHRVTNKRYRVLAARDGSALLMALDLAGGAANGVPCARCWRPRVTGR